jgi:hypothetical protein
MRAAKITLAFSTSAFLLALSWALLTGTLTPVRNASAQAGDPFVGVATTQTGLFVAVTESGEVWEFRHSTAREFRQVAKLGQLVEQ